jgi:hypothetical protein
MNQATLSAQDLSSAPLFLDINHYYTDKSIDDIRIILINACAFIGADVIDSYNVLDCSTFQYQLETHFKLNIFTTHGSEWIFEHYPFVIEIQMMNGDGIGFINIVQQLRTFFYSSGFVSKPTKYSTFEVLSWPEYDEPEDAAHEDAAPEENVALDTSSQQTVRNLLGLMMSDAVDVKSGALSALSDLVHDESVRIYITEEDICLVVECLRLGVAINDSTLQRYAVSTLSCLFQTKANIEAVKDGIVDVLNQVVRSCDLSQSSSHHLLRECASCLALIGEHNPLLLQQIDM